MKAKLKPEEERVVTPGPKAVDDLLRLPSPESREPNPWIDIGAVGVQVLGETKEKYHHLLVAKDIIQDEEGRLVVATPAAMARELIGPGSFLPSAPLILTVMNSLYDVLDTEYIDLLESLRDTLHNTYLSTRFDWKNQRVEHYPHIPGATNQPKSYGFDFGNISLQGSYLMEDAVRDIDAALLLHATLGVWQPRWLCDLFQVHEVFIEFPQSVSTDYSRPRIAIEREKAIVTLTDGESRMGYGRRMKSK